VELLPVTGSRKLPDPVPDLFEVSWHS
jgi:hypothetical protein